MYELNSCGDLNVIELILGTVFFFCGSGIVGAETNITLEENGLGTKM